MNKIDAVCIGNRKKLKVVQQKRPEQVYVGNVFTQFSLAPAIGLLAHNNSKIADCAIGDYVTVWAGSVPSIYRVEDISTWRALEPDSPTSNFASHENPLLVDGSLTTAKELFDDIYGWYPLVLQTCIERDGIPTWGRRFVCCVLAADPCQSGERREG
jgi:hypothetical protein